MSDVKNKKKSKKLRKIKESKVIPFKKKFKVLNNSSPVCLRKAEIDRINAHSKEIVKDLRKFVNEARISREDAWYNILYYIKQEVMWSTNVAYFKLIDEHTTKENKDNYKSFIEEHHPELNVHPTNPEKLH